MAIEYTPESSLVSDPAEGGSFSTSNDAELAGAQSFAAKAKLAQIAAEQAETNAENSATSASGAASTASTFATNAANSATASANSATAAATSATNAANSATAASGSATDSANSATASAGSATDSANSATASASSATASAGSATDSANSATASASSATDSANSATASAGSATAAAGSATAAAGSATSASNSATDSANSATASASSATDSANSATASANSATAAAGSATAASNSATAASGSATDAANSATAAANSATASAGSATSSSNSATSAATAQTAAEAARDAALAAFDSFDDRYLGQKSSDPSTDNDGDALVAGTLYFNTTTDAMMVYEGSSWVAAYASLSGALIANNNLSDLNNAATARTNLGLGTIATAAATDYVPVTGGTFTGNVESPEFIGTLQGEVVFKAKAGEAITKGDAVYVSGISGNTPLVSKADADDAAKMPAFGLSADTVSANAAMEVVILGQLTNMDTSGYTLGDTLYISNTPGVLSATKPAGESSQLQNIGKVERVHASTGSILVSGSGRSAATPNLNDGQFFLGNGSNQAVSTDFTTSVLGEISAGTGIGISGGGVISNSAPDQTVSLTGAGTTTVSGTYPNFTITGAGTTYTASNGITLSGTDFQLTDTNAKLNLTGGTLTGNLIIDQGTSGDATLTLRADTDNNDEGDHPQIRFQQDGDLVGYRFGIGTSATDTATSNNDLCITAEGSASSQLYMVTSTGVQHKFWHAGNDGPGSGLDADLLKGYNISAGGNRWGVIPTIDANGVMEVGEYIDFHENDNDQGDHSFRLQSDGNQGGASLTANGHLVLNNGATDGAHLYLRSNVAPTFGINNNGGNLVFDDGTEVMRLNYQNRVGIGTSSPAQALHVVGSIVATGNITAYYSDERLKDFKGKIDNPLEKINTLNGYYFKPNETALIAGAEQNGLEVGVSAQEVEKVLPEIVSPSALGKDYKTVSYEKLTPLLIEAVKELSAKVDDLESRLDELEK